MSLTWGRQRITGASLVNAQYDLTLERQTIMDNILFIPGIANPVSEINSLLFGAGQQGTFIAPSLTPSLISGSTFGTGVQTLTDLSPRNNPLSQATSGNRAAWFREPKTGRRNLFEQTEDFTNAYWEKGRVTLSTGLAPDGSAATVMTETAETGTHRVIRTTPGVAGTDGNTQYVLSAFYKSNTGTPLALLAMTDINGARQVRAWFNLTSGTVGTVENASTATGAAASIVAIGDGWYRCTITGRMNIAGQIVGFIGMAETDGVQSYLGDTGRSVLLWRPQIEVGSTTTATAYQRVTTAFDVTESGQRDCYGVLPDSVDDWYQTGNINMTGTDEVTVFASFRKTTDAAVSIIAEFSNSRAANNGAFTVASTAGPSTLSAFNSKGTADSINQQTNAAPTTTILTGIGKILTDLNILRLNGVQIASITSDQGTGNFGNYPLFLFSRGGASLFGNARLYALIVAGGSYPSSTIQRVERLLSRITPTVNL